MSNYLRLNRYLGMAIVGLFFTFLLTTELYPIQCSISKVTGLQCRSCGLTRDFFSYIRGDFANPVNDYSLRLFLYLSLQFCYRILIGYIYPLTYIDKKIIFVDIIVSVIGAAYCLYPLIFFF